MGRKYMAYYCFKSTPSWFWSENIISATRLHDIGLNPYCKVSLALIKLSTNNFIPPSINHKHQCEDTPRYNIVSSAQLSVFTGQTCHLKKINVAEIAQGKQNNNHGETLTKSARSRKTNGASPRRQASTTQLYGKIYAHNTVCLQSVRAQGILLVKSNSSSSSAESELTVSTHTLKIKIKNQLKYSPKTPWR